MKKLNKILIECLNQGMVLYDIEKVAVESALEVADYTTDAAADLLGITPPKLCNKMKLYGFQFRKRGRGRATPIEQLSPLGQLLRRERIKKNYALKTVAYEIGHQSPSYLSKVELGRKLPLKPMLTRIATALNLQPSILEQAMEEVS